MSTNGRNCISSTAQRAKLAECLVFLRDGDALVVTKPDRLARSTADAAFGFAALDPLLGDPFAFLRRVPASVDGIRIGVADSFFWDGCENGIDEVVRAHAEGLLGVHDEVVVRLPAGREVVTESGTLPAERTSRRVTTTVGRVLFNDHLGADLAFYDLPLTGRNLNRLIADAQHRLGTEATVALLDAICGVVASWLMVTVIVYGVEPG